MKLDKFLDQTDALLGHLGGLVDQAGEVLTSQKRKMEADTRAAKTMQAYYVRREENIKAYHPLEVARMEAMAKADEATALAHKAGLEANLATKTRFEAEAEYLANRDAREAEAHEARQLCDAAESASRLRVYSVQLEAELRKTEASFVELQEMRETIKKRHPLPDDEAVEGGVEEDE